MCFTMWEKFSLKGLRDIANPDFCIFLKEKNPTFSRDNWSNNHWILIQLELCFGPWTKIPWVMIIELNVEQWSIWPTSLKFSSIFVILNSLFWMKFLTVLSLLWQVQRPRLMNFRTKTLIEPKFKNHCSNFLLFQE